MSGKAEKIGLGWSRDEIVDRLARIIRNKMGPDYWQAPPPEWATGAAETIWRNVEAIVRDRLEMDRADIARLRVSDEGLRAALEETFGAVAFLRSAIRSGERLNAEDDERIDATLERANRALSSEPERK